MEALGLEKKANESMHATQATFGEEFVPSDLAQNIIDNARDESKVIDTLNSENIIDMPTNPYTLPVEGADPTFVGTSESEDVPESDVTTSKAGTADMVLTAKKFSTTVYLSGELEEDARVAGGIRGYVEKKIGLAYGELIDKMLILGDVETGATGNINSDDGALAAGTDFLQFDGMVVQAFDDSLTQDGGTLDAQDFLDARSNLGGKKGANPEKLIYIMNPETYFKTLALTQVETAEKITSATIENGVLKAIYGTPIVVNSDFGLTEADGKVSTTPSNNTKGRFVCAYLPHIFVGWKRRLKMTIEYLPRTDQWAITAHTRFTMNFSETGSVSYKFNLTV